MITIKEIARKLDLSPTTVSNVIRGKTGEVSSETIKRVQKFLEEVDYVPNISARNLAQNESRIIGVVLKMLDYKYDNIFKDPFVSEMIGGIEKAVRKAGYFMMLYISNDIAEILKHISTWNVDGLILFCMLDDDGIRVKKKYRKNVVCIDTYVSDDVLKMYPDSFVNVGLDDEDGAYQGTRYLLECGHRKIGFLANTRDGVDLHRFRGYRKALDEFGVEYSDFDFFHLRAELDEIDKSFEKLARRSKDYTAVFCCSDLYAVRFINECEMIGIHEPDDLSVVGFYDNYCGALCRPPLTTIHQDAEYKGVLAARTLIDLIHGKSPEKNQMVLKPTLVIRESVKKLI